MFRFPRLLMKKIPLVLISAFKFQRHINIIHTTKNMAQFVAEQDLNKIAHCSALTSSGSPCPQSVTMSASEAFACAQMEDAQKFEICDQIQSNNLHFNEKNQDKKPWSLKQQELLLQIHGRLGNKWTQIANQLPGKDHNSVKNHFYAKIRKSLRRINYFIKIYFNKQLKQLNLSHVSKMITMMSEKKNGFVLNEAYEENIMNIKKFMFQMSQKQQQEDLGQDILQRMRSIVNKITDLLQLIKKANSTTKNSQQKTKQKTAQCSRFSARQPKTTTIQVKSQPCPPSSNPLPINYVQNNQQIQLPINQTNMMIMLMPWPQFVPTSPVEYSWVDTSQHFVYFGNNIFGNS